MEGERVTGETMIDVFLFISFLALLGVGYAVGTGKLFNQSAMQRGLVIDDIRPPTVTRGSAIWFYSDSSTAQRYGHLGKLQRINTDKENGDTYHVLFLSRHVDFDSVLRDMAQQATNINPRVFKYPYVTNKAYQLERR